MKKVVCFLLALIAAVTLAACTQQRESKEQEKEEVVETPADEKNANPIEEKTPETPDEPDSEKEQKSYQNDVFKDVLISDSGDQILIIGKAQVFEGVFQYRLIDGDEVLLEDRYQTAGAPEWGDFTINFEKDVMTSDQATFELFVYSPKDGAKMNELEISVKK